MKELFIKILRFLMFVLVVALGCIGYNIYEDTLAGCVDTRRWDLWWQSLHFLYIKNGYG